MKFFEEGADYDLHRGAPVPGAAVSAGEIASNLFQLDHPLRLAGARDGHTPFYAARSNSNTSSSVVWENSS